MINAEMKKIHENGLPDGNSSELIARIRALHQDLTNSGKSSPAASASKPEKVKKVTETKKSPGQRVCLSKSRRY